MKTMDVQEIVEQYPNWRTDKEQKLQLLRAMDSNCHPPADVLRALELAAPLAKSIAEYMVAIDFSAEEFSVLIYMQPSDVRRGLRGEDVEPSRLLVGLVGDLPWVGTRGGWRVAAQLARAEGKTPLEILQACGCRVVDAPTLGEALMRSNITQSQLAFALGVTPAQVNVWISVLSWAQYAKLVPIFPGLRPPASARPEAAAAKTPLAAQLKERGLTQAAVARMLGCTVPLVNHWCTGRARPSAAMQEKLEAILGGAVLEPVQPVDVLLDWLDEKGMLAEAVAYMQSRGF